MMIRYSWYILQVRRDVNDCIRQLTNALVFHSVYVRTHSIENAGEVGDYISNTYWKIYPYY